MKSWLGKAYVLLLDFDLIIFILTTQATGFVSLVLGRSQTIRPFYPEDVSLWNLYTGDTIHTGFVFAILYFLLGPLIYFAEKRTLQRKNVPTEQRHRSALRMALGLLNCTMIAILIIEMGKGYVGRLRPSFAQTCLSPARPPYRPGDAVAIPGTDGETGKIRVVYNSDADCSTLNRHALRDARRSFPSGHAALAVSGAVYGQLVLARLAREATESEFEALVVYGVGWLWFVFAAWVSASRVFDNAHHVGDVAVGALVGVWCGAVHFWYVCGRNERAQRRAALEVSEKAN